MDVLRPSDCCGARWRRFSLWTAVRGLLALAILTTPQVHAAVECEEFTYGKERLDYNSLGDRPRIRQIETNHFHHDWELLGPGVTSVAPGSDIDFVVRASPNHHRGLAAMVRLSLRDKTPRPSGVKIPVEC